MLPFHFVFKLLVFGITGYKRKKQGTDSSAETHYPSQIGKITSTVPSSLFRQTILFLLHITSKSRFTTEQRQVDVYMHRCRIDVLI